MDDTYSVPGVGTVVSGTTLRYAHDQYDRNNFSWLNNYCIIYPVSDNYVLNIRGTINLNDMMMLGPDSLGHFQPIAIKSIHRKRMPVAQVRGECIRF